MPARGEAAEPPATGARLRHAREQFLEGDHSVAGVRNEVQASWHRSQSLAVRSDRVDPPYVERANGDSLLMVSATPALRSLQEKLNDEPVSMLLTDARGVVLHRVCTDGFLGRCLDDVSLSPGFDHTESSVGTNGIGTALEMRAPTLIHGDEHYADGLSQFSCAAAMVHHPITGATMGVIDITTRARAANDASVAFALSAAQLIEDQLLARVSSREVALMRDYLTTCHHTGGAVLAVSDELVMMNTHTQQTYSSADQSALLALVRDAAGSRKPMTLVTELPSGGTARLEFRPTLVEEAQAGGIFRIQSHDVPTPRETHRSASAPSLPGVVGQSGNWQRTCRAVLSSRRRQEWLVLAGESGTGKTTLLRGAHLADDPQAPLLVLDCADWVFDGAEDTTWTDRLEDALGRDGGTVVLQHAHRLERDAPNTSATCCSTRPRTVRSGPGCR